MGDSLRRLRRKIERIQSHSVECREVPQADPALLGFRRRLDLVRLLPARLELGPGRKLLVATELLPHRREHLVGEVILIAGGETLEERSREHRRRDADVDSGLDRPATLAGVRYPPGQAVQLWGWPARQPP